METSLFEIELGSISAIAVATISTVTAIAVIGKELFPLDRYDR